MYKDAKYVQLTKCNNKTWVYVHHHQIQVGCELTYPQIFMMLPSRKQRANPIFVVADYLSKMAHFNDHKETNNIIMQLAYFSRSDFFNRVS